MSTATQSIAHLPSHVRVKRAGVTLFLHCDLRNDTILVMKERIERLLGAPVISQRLYLGRQMMPNHSTLWEAGIEIEDAEVILAYSLGFINPDVELFETPEEALDGRAYVKAREDAEAAAAAAAEAAALAAAQGEAAAMAAQA
jgi:hypothetical protein